MTTTTHPLAAAYLTELERLLAGIAPAERAEVLAGVHEHLAAAVGPNDDDETVRAVIAELGSPQSVADEAYAASPPAPAPPGLRPVAGPSRPWVPTVVGLLGAVALLGLLGAALTGGLGLVIMTVLPASVLWLVLVGLVTTSRHIWSGAEKLVLCLLLPLAWVVTATTSIALLNNGLPTDLIPWLGLAVAVGGGAPVLHRLVGRGRRRAEAALGTS